MRISLIHALPISVAPVADAFSRLWPQANTVNLTDDSLAGDLAAHGSLQPGMTDRFIQLARYAAATGADAILFTCSAFGPCIEACARDLAPLPVLKPNEAMIEECIALAGTQGQVGLLATFQPTLATMPLEFMTLAPGLKLQTALATKALDALLAGDVQAHDLAAAEVAAQVFGECDVIALAQFSLSSAAGRIAQVTGKPVLTAPDSAVRKLRRLLEH
jgi:hypothetical protein